MKPRVLFADDLGGLAAPLGIALADGAEVVELPPPGTTAAPPDAIVAASRTALEDVGRKFPAAARVGLAATLGEGAVLAWPPGSADRLLVATDSIADALVASGWAAAAVLATGLPVDPGFAPPADLEAARRAAGIASGPVVAVRPSAIDAWGPVPLFVQLGLVADDPFVVFDVGLDPSLAEKLREAIPIHDLRAGLVSEGEGHAARLALADLVLGGGGLREVAEALAAGSAFVALDPEPDGSLSLAIEAGAVAPVRSHGRLAVELEEILRSRLAGARAAASKLGQPGAARAVADAIRAAAKDAPALRASRGRPPGLPSGLEIVGAARTKRTRSATAEPDVEKDLAALRERISKGG